MTDLITISKSNFDGQSINTVNARDLHAFLEVGKDFSTWAEALEYASVITGRWE